MNNIVVNGLLVSLRNYTGDVAMYFEQLSFVRGKRAWDDYAVLQHVQNLSVSEMHQHSDEDEMLPLRCARDKIT